jgi:hypothetical protein
LIAAYLTEERRGGRARTVREFVAEFRELSSTAKQKAVTMSPGLSGAYLHDLVEDGDVALAFVNRLLTAMQRESREVKAEALGVLGEAHVATYLSTHYQVEPMSLKYRKLVGVTEGLLFVLEVACGWYTTEVAARAGRRSIVGINWTPALKPPFVELPALLALTGKNVGSGVATLPKSSCPILSRSILSGPRPGTSCLTTGPSDRAAYPLPYWIGDLGCAGLYRLLA